MSVAIKKKMVTPPINGHSQQMKFNKKKANNMRKRKKLTSSSSNTEKSFVPGGDETDPLNLKDPDLTMNYTPSPDHNQDLPTPVVFVDQSDPLSLKRSPKQKRERKNSRHKSGTSDNQENTVLQVKFNEKGKKFCYGNYSKYYGYRNPDNERDVRLQVLNRAMFCGKDVLDLGCNIGHITLTIAKEFEPKKIVGVDIDGNLINVARKNIRRYISKENSSMFPVSMQVCYGPIFGQDSKDTSFPNNVAFRKENWVPQGEAVVSTEMFDVIVCLSVTKWVHLNWGDSGIEKLFKKMYRSLRPGGKLILECQHWKSYARRKKLTPNIYKNYSQIHIRPEEFPRYLMAIGFDEWKTLGVPYHNHKGFRRPVWMFSKPSQSSDCQGSQESSSRTCDSPLSSPFSQPDGEPKE